MAKSFARDQEADEPDGDRRSGRFGGVNGRRYEREDWGTRPRRNFDGDDSERRQPRSAETRWERRPAGTGFGDETRKEIRDEGLREERRYGQRPGRARFEQPWLRGENGGEALEVDGKGQQRSRAWGRDRRSGADDWNARNEQDPEWMDAMEPEEMKQAHTAEDFQKWKERMKADNERHAPPADADVQEALEGMSLQEKEPAPKPTQPKIKPDTDKFFELFGEKKEKEEAPPMMETKKHKTRFAALFSPPPEEPKSAIEPSLPPNDFVEQPDRPASTDADHEGFQRILQMLGGKSKPGVNPMEALLNPRLTGSRGDPAGPNPLAGLFMGQDLSRSEQQKPEAKPPSRSSGGLESLLGPQSPRHDQKRDSAPSKDSDFLLRLMQQSKMTPSPQPPQQQQAPQSNHVPGILQMPEALNRSRQPVKSPGGLPSFFDDPAIANSQRLPPPRGEDFDMHQRLGPRLQMQNDYPPRPEYPKSPQDQLPHHPSAMHHPPGFDSGPPPSGWAHQQHHQQFPPQQQLPPPQQQGPMHAPPGIPNPNATRGMPPFPSGPPMPHHNMQMPPPLQDNRQPPQPQQRKIPSGGPFPPPGMQPPPGFMANHPGGPPPPGFPPMPMGGNDGMGGMPMGGGRDGGLPHQQAGMPPRHLMDLFAMSGGGGGERGGRGGGGMPGPYR